MDWCGYVTGSSNCFYRAGVSANISETFFNIETSRAHKKKKLFLFFSGGGGYWIWHAVFSCWQKMRGGGIWNFRLVYNLKSKLQKKSKGGIHFGIFHTTILPPRAALFSNEHNFFSIQHWMVLQKYVSHKNYPNKIKIISTLSVSHKHFIFLSPRGKFI